MVDTLVEAGQVWRFQHDGSMYLLLERDADLEATRGLWFADDVWRSVCLDNPEIPGDAGRIDHVCVVPGDACWERVG